MWVSDCVTTLSEGTSKSNFRIRYSTKDNTTPIVASKHSTLAHNVVTFQPNDLKWSPWKHTCEITAGSLRSASYLAYNLPYFGTLTHHMPAILCNVVSTHAEVFHGGGGMMYDAVCTVHPLSTPFLVTHYWQPLLQVHSNPESVQEDTLHWPVLVSVNCL